MYYLKAKMYYLKANPIAHLCESRKYISIFKEKKKKRIEEGTPLM